MRYTLITQIVLITLSLILVFTFLKPAFGDIKGKQDDLFLYKDTVSKVEELNRTLQALVATKNSFSPTDLSTLSTFIPEKIDSIKVMRDIESVFVTLDKPLLSLIPKEVVAPRSSGEVEFESAIEVPAPEAVPVIVYQDFDVKFVGTYFEAKNLLQMLEKNETLLEVVDFNLDPITSELLDDKAVVKDTAEGLFGVSLVVRTFGLSNL
jgi:hypothetical protein